MESDRMLGAYFRLFSEKYLEAPCTGCTEADEMSICKSVVGPL